MNEKEKESYRSINALRSQVRELQLKYDNQSVQLKQTEDELKELKNKYRKLRAESQGGDGSVGNEGEVSVLRDLLTQQEGKNEQLAAAREKAEYEKEQLSSELKELRRLVDQMKDEKNSQAARMEILDETLENVKGVAFQYEEENRRLTDIIQDLEARELELRESLSAKDEILGSLQTEAKLIGKQKNDMTVAKRESNRNRRQLLLMAENTNRIQSELHMNLLNYKKMLDELKLEYEEHTETVRAEWNMERRGRVDEHTKLKQQFENLKLIQFEDKQQLLREQREVVKALQTQFQEYRNTAEYLFATESKKLQDKLRSQMEKYEEEIKYIVKAKDQHFDMMMTTKDAKIMNLIEGSDLQTILIKHEQELEQVRRSHVEDLEQMRLKTEAEQREVMSELKKEIASCALVEEKLKMTIHQLEDQLRAANDANEKRMNQMAQKDDRHIKDLQHLQGMLQKAHEQCEKLNQEKQDLRHRIVRLKFQAKGDMDESLPNLVKRLSIEITGLRAKHNALIKKQERFVKELKSLQQKTIIQTQQLDQARTMVGAKEQEMKDMLQTLSKILYYRIQGKFGHKTHLSEKGRQETGASEEPLNYRQAIATLQRVLDGQSARNNNNQSASQDEKIENLFQEEGVEDSISTVSTAEEEQVNHVEPEHSEKELQEGVEKQKNRKKNAKVSPRVRTKVPTKWQAMLSGDGNHLEKVDRAEVLELARGINYLKKFQKVNAAYTVGKFQAPSASHQSMTAYESLNMLDASNSIHGQKEEWWQGIPLYQDSSVDDGDSLVQKAATSSLSNSDGSTSPTKPFRPAPPHRK